MAAPLDGAELVRAFSNTLDAEDRTDQLPDTQALVKWLRERDLVDAKAAAAPADLELALELRAALRGALLAHHDDADDPASLLRLNEVAAQLPLRASFAPGRGPALAASGAGVGGALATVMAAIVESAADGSWRRLKICPADDCQWTFYDQSRNQSRRWCGAGCRNVEKTRAYRARQRA
ncbi:MAG TPA: CGNR zinc finger domain-containing protein [Egibacteraceae bacterium]|nr:CGNR zinc finger domain-containing protein [Egibacteraceae bacterium]